MSRNSKNNSKGSTLKTIRCHLDASEDVLRKIWEEMTQKNTPLIIQLLKSVSEQPEFEANKEKGYITNKEITKLRESITENSELEKQSGRLRSSVDSFVKQVYSSWLTLYQKREKQKEGKEYFLNNILKSDVELVEESSCDLQTIRSKAQEILSQPEEFLKKINNLNNKQTKSSPKRSKKNSEKQNSVTKQDADKNIPKTVNEILYDIHRNTQEVVIRCAVSYLLKNNNKVSELEEDIKKLEKRRTEKEVQIRRLEKEIQNSRLPNGRDITGEIYNEAFDNLINQVPKNNEEYKEWIDNLSKKVSNLPYPISYLYGDLTGCYKNEKGHIIVYFNGWANYKFKICCNQRQRHFFERFLEDYKTFKESEKGEGKLSGSLSTLRFIQLLWQHNHEQNKVQLRRKEEREK
ncbi:MAG: type V CRISPR-associated protein Cas12k [Nostoc sp.]|uniref:type V CRISPR-associated protein Cas12k n=1 Tax=Nostoc sp. TaxID=1180 RepID=UPI002FF54686